MIRYIDIALGAGVIVNDSAYYVNLYSWFFTLHNFQIGTKHKNVIF